MSSLMRILSNSMSQKEIINQTTIRLHILITFSKFSIKNKPSNKFSKNWLSLFRVLRMEKKFAFLLTVKREVEKLSQCKAGKMKREE